MRQLPPEPVFFYPDGVVRQATNNGERRRPNNDSQGNA
jgi:hypothetical protein